MYQRTFWRDRAVDQTGQVIQHGTLQDQAHFNNMEDGIVELAHHTAASRNTTGEFFLGSGGGEAVSVLFALEFLFHGTNLRVGRTPFVFDVCVIPHKRRKRNAQLVQRILRLYGKITSCKITANAVNLYKRSDNK